MTSPYNDGTEAELTAVMTELKSLDTLTTWDNIPEIGKEVSGKGLYRAGFIWNGNFDGAYIDFGKTVQSMKVYINGKKTDNINMNKPIADISWLVVKGKNEIYIEYSSNLTNVQIARGAVTDGVVLNGFLGYDTTYRSYGISRARIIPYIK